MTDGRLLILFVVILTVGFFFFLMNYFCDPDWRIKVNTFLIAFFGNFYVKAGILLLGFLILSKYSGDMNCEFHYRR